MASSSSSKYLYPPEDFDVTDFVTIKLSDTNYKTWKAIMLRLIGTQGLLGFINGEISPPPAERITVPDGSDGTREKENMEYKEWERSDGLLRGWILATLSQDLLPQVSMLKTAQDVWLTLAKALNQPVLDETKTGANRACSKNLAHYLPLYEAALQGDWETASTILEQDPKAFKAIITGASERALFVAIRSPRKNHFLTKLVEHMSATDLAFVDEDGSTALHIAAIAGNIEAAKLLVNKNSDLPNILDNSNSLPLHSAAVCGQREMFLYLMTVTNANMEPKPFEDESGVRLLRALITYGYYDLAFTLVKCCPKLACWDPSPLQSITERHYDFQSGARLKHWQRLIYKCVPAQLENLADQHSGGDIENPFHGFILELKKAYRYGSRTISVGPNL
ncbi:unnamed protein product [Ilex paraguariensis]|uniref:Retrotransposon Copia-like N-terminal domain-containing protein n=1 Tax=Ilex paraguariensis TaxID=185542 RepID=A0ABC8V4S8_9AQUA